MGPERKPQRQRRPARSAAVHRAADAILNLAGAAAQRECGFDAPNGSVALCDGTLKMRGATARDSSTQQHDHCSDRAVGAAPAGSSASAAMDATGQRRGGVRGCRIQQL
ncbi:hypothetical protein CUR178_07510 [Leishmania enriettii]|uniref:Uncharacterized protein n=1 Tax=Leishmania enriettii TaxID=5663 RepID=A0A836KT31_LEIEN|nr:hypothetical protein CUR178_07510 [Leishmania enriettii]